MTYRLRDAFRRADLSLAGAVFLSLGTTAAVPAFIHPVTSNAAEAPKFRSSIVEATDMRDSAEGPAEAPTIAPLPIANPTPSAPAAPEILPAPRPAPTFFSRLKIKVALENLAAETGCLAEALYYEARGQSVLGQQAIAEVVVRRAQRAGFPHSICGVVHQGSGSACQFSFVCDGTMDRPKAVGEWNHALRLASKIVTGAMPLTNITQGAISFHAASIDAGWPGMERTVIVGNNVFYRKPARRLT